MDGSLSNVIFAGVFHHSMDAKNRVTIPARWRRSEVDEFYTVPSAQGEFLRVIPPEEIQRKSQEILSNPKLSMRDRAIWERGFYSRAQHVTTDRQGRIVLPEEQCKMAELKGEVTLLGVDRMFEIWSPEKRKRAAESEEEIYANISKLVGL